MHSLFSNEELNNTFNLFLNKLLNFNFSSLWNLNLYFKIQKMKDLFKGDMMINLIKLSFDIGDLTINAFNAIIESDIIINYDNIDLDDLDSYIRDKEIILRQEDESEEDSNVYSNIKKGYSLIELAISKSYNNVTVICSNSSNIYGIANLLIQISSKHEDVELKIYPGVSPIDYSSAVLGAPLNDFAAIDLNNPIESSNELENKIKMALENDFVLFVHNLKGNEFISNEDQNNNYNRLKEIVSDFNEDLLVGIVNDNYSYEICKFKDIRDEVINESSTLIIGNKLTYRLEDYMVTSCDYIVKPKFISQNMDFFERYLKDETPKGIDYDCDYLPCHKKLESCDFCYCPFYPCADGLTGGEWIKGKNVWSCQHCDWIHLEEPCKAIREGLDDILKEPNDLKTKHIELLKLRRECLLKTLK